MEHAWRTLRRAPVVTGLGVLVLGIVLGVNASIFDIVYTFLVQPIPAMRIEELVVFYETDEGNREPLTSYPRYIALTDSASTVFDGVAASTGQSYDVVISGAATSIQIEIVSSNFLDVLGITPAIGRAFMKNEDGAVCLLSYRFWQRRFDLDPDVIGTSFPVGGISPTVVGVMPRELGRWRNAVDVWIALESAPALFSNDELNNDGYKIFTLFGHVDPEYSRLAAQHFVNALETNSPEGSNEFELVPLRTHLVDYRTRQSMVLLALAMGLLLLVALANVASLLVSIKTAQLRQLVIQLSLGASRSRLFGQSVLEGIVVGLFGGIAGLVVTFVTTSLVNAARPSFETGFQLEMGGHLALLELAVSVAIGVLCGLSSGLFVMQRSRHLVPASISHVSSFLGASDPTSGERIRSFLLVSQVAFALILLAGVGLMIKTVAQLDKVVMVSDPYKLAQVALGLPQDRYPYANVERRNVYVNDLVRAVSTLPSVELAGVATSIPSPNDEYRRSIWLDDGRRFLNGDVSAHGQTPGRHAVTPNHFRALGIDLLRGRDFETTDGPDAPRVVIVNQALAEALWPNEDPLMKRIRFGSKEPWHQVVGIVGNIPYGSPRNSAKPEAYVSFPQHLAASFWLIVKSSSDAAFVLGPVLEVVRTMDPLVPVLQQQTAAEAIAASISETRYTAWVLSGLGALALILSAAGSFGVASHLVARRTFELGVRMVLGATPSMIWALVVKRIAILGLLGSALGLFLAVPFTRYIESILFGVEPFDGSVLLVAVLFLVSCCIVSVVAPARKATAVDPGRILYHE